ncbi:hypothetical protein ACEQPO_07940 [Bacillus sp. SL00103]
MLTIIMNSGKEYTTKKYPSVKTFLEAVQGHLDASNASEYSWMSISDDVFIRINQISSIEFND